MAQTLTSGIAVVWPWRAGGRLCSFVLPPVCLLGSSQRTELDSLHSSQWPLAGKALCLPFHLSATIIQTALIGFPAVVFGRLPQPPRCLACDGDGGVAALRQAAPGTGEAALKSPTGAGQENLDADTRTLGFI